MKVLKCPVCGRVKITARKNKTCSHRCDMLGRDRAVLAAQGRKASQRSAVTRWNQAMARWARAYPGFDPKLAREIYLKGYNSGWSAGRRKGWAQALGESDAA